MVSTTAWTIVHCTIVPAISESQRDSLMLRSGLLSQRPGELMLIHKDVVLTGVQDDKNDWLRLFHSCWHLCVG